MPVNNPDRAFFWDATNKSWRAAQVGDPGEYVWNDTTKSWEFGDIGAEYKWNRTTRAWEPGPGGQYVYNRSTKSWDKVTSPGYGGPFYWDTSTNSWVKNTDAAQVSDAFARWDFINNQAWWDGAYVGALANTPNWTFTRASTGYAENEAGVLIPFASGELRRTDKGVLIEGARTNLCLQSQTFDNASWQKPTGGVASAPTVTANYAEAPDGTTTADRVQFALNGGTAAADRSYILQAVTISTATAYTFSFYAKSNGGSVAIGFGGDNIVGNTAATVTSEWQRFSVTATSSSTSTNLFIQLRGGQTPTQADSADLLIWGAQLEAASFPSSYIPTTTASATRAADSLTVTGVTGLDYPLTLFAEFERGVDTGGTEAIFGPDSGSGNDEALLYVDSADRAHFFSELVAANQSDINIAGAIAVGDVVRVAARISTNDINLASLGTLGTQDTSCANPNTPTRILFAARNSGNNPSFGYLRRAAIYASAKTDAQLEAMTA